MYGHSNSQTPTCRFRFREAGRAGGVMRLVTHQPTAAVRSRVVPLDSAFRRGL